ncbi:MAG: RsmB/NOP family class I SAM-dependent RNA methyltransferase [Rhodospirillales bacterium]
MIPASRFQASIELTQAIAEDRRPADQVVSDYLRGRRYIGAKDRRWLTQAVYDRLRRLARLTWWLRRCDLFVDARSQALAEQILVAGQDIAGLGQLCSGERFAPDKLDPEEKRKLRSLEGEPLDHPDQAPDIAGECPDWLLERLPERPAELLKALCREAPLDLRVNLLATTRAEAQAALAKEEIPASETALSPLGLRVAGRRNVAATEAFRGGLIERQDEGSQLAALLVEAQPGERVCDFCAGAGGKSLALAAAMANKGSLVALDVSKTRLDRAGQRLRRAGAFNVTRRVLSDHRDPWVKRHKAGFDRVLVDAPCSGIGAWRRNPDARWRTLPEDLARLAALQGEILASAARLVKPGGRLVYVTCSLLAEENQDQVAAFLTKTPGFAQQDIATLRPELAQGVDSVGGLTLRPDREGTDGFYVAVLSRQNAEAAA